MSQIVHAMILGSHCNCPDSSPPLLQACIAMAGKEIDFHLTFECGNLANLHAVLPAEVSRHVLLKPRCARCPRHAVARCKQALGRCWRWYPAAASADRMAD